MGDFGGGGGFMGQGGTPSSQNSGDGDKKDRISTLTPLSIFQVQNAEIGHGEQFTIDNVALGQVSVIAVVRSVDAKATKIQYTIEDHTGAMDVTRWVDEGSEDTGEGECREGTYVRVVGTLKSYQDKRGISAHKVFPVTDPNEITQHLLEVLFCHLRNTKGALDDNGKVIQNVAAGGMVGGGFNNTMGNPGAPGGGSTFDAGGGTGGNDYSMRGGGGAQNNGIGGTPVQNEALDIIRSCDSDTGINIDQICQQLRGKYTEDNVREAIDWLGCEGHVYSTIDEEHFRATDA